MDTPTVLLMFLLSNSRRALVLGSSIDHIAFDVLQVPNSAHLRLVFIMTSFNIIDFTVLMGGEVCADFVPV